MTAFKLDEHPKINSGFKTPNDYFDDFPEKVDAKISNLETPVIPISRRKNWLYAAAAVLVVGLGVTVFNALSVQSSVNDSAAIENYLATQYSTEDLLVEALEKEDIEQLSANYNLDEQALEEELSTNANLEQYIID